MATSAGGAEMRAGLQIALIGVVLFAEGTVNAASVSGTYAGDLPRIRHRAARDKQVLRPGEEKTKAERAFQLVDILQTVENGDRFTVDTGDRYIGAIIDLLGGMRTRRSFETPQDEALLVEYYQKANTLHALQTPLVKGSWTEAALLVSSVADKYPAYGPAWTSLGLVKTAAGEYDEAQTFFRRAKGLSIDPQTYHGSALAYLAQGKEAEAKQEIDMAVKLDPRLEELSFAGLQNLKGAKPEAWAAYRDQLGGRVSLAVIERAFEGATPEAKAMPEEKRLGPGTEDQQGTQKRVPEGTGKIPILPLKR